ncbi:MAG TPA: hypothetical protein VJP83_10145 [Terriglobales bacterium]|nr:hypothetical protein [Terriglobales bacterium]
MPAWAQYGRPAQTSKEPRATAILQLQDKRARIVPIVIRINGQFYDASIYRADPRPMALDTGVVYEAERSGSSVGLFTVGNALQVGNNWYGLGHWQTNEEMQQAKEARAREEEQAKAAKRAEAAAEDSGPPILRKSGGAKPTQPPPQPPSPPHSTNPAPTPPAQTAKTTPPPSPAPASPSSASDEYDPNRPVLRRGAPAATSQEETWPAELAPSKPASTTGGKPAPAEPKIEQLVAISDADGPELRSYDFNLNPVERDADYKKMASYAQDAVSKYERLRHTDFASAQLGATDFRFFDVDLSNEPVFVLSAPATVNFGAVARARGRRRPARRATQLNEPVSGKQEQAYVTVVGKVDLYGEVKLIFSSVTDSTHLDEIPRLQLIDAVDVDGDKRGELLFQETTDSGTGYIIYRVYPDQLTPLFDSRGPED